MQRRLKISVPSRHIISSRTVSLVYRQANSQRTTYQYYSLKKLTIDHTVKVNVAYASTVNFAILRGALKTYSSLRTTLSTHKQQCVRSHSGLKFEMFRILQFNRCPYPIYTHSHVMNQTFVLGGTSQINLLISLNSVNIFVKVLPRARRE